MSAPGQNRFFPVPWPVLQVMLVRLLMVTVVAGSSALVWWSVSHRLVPASRLVDAKSRQFATLADEVQQLEMGWNPKSAEQTNLRFEKARARLFATDEALALWREETEHSAEALNLQTSIQLGKPQVHPAAGQGLAILPVTVDVRPLEIPLATNSPYCRLLQFASNLPSGEKRVDIVELSVSAGSNSMRQVKLVVNAWAPGKARP